MIEFLFWLSLIIVGYTYIGYILVLLLIWGVKRALVREKDNMGDYEPEVTIFIAAYNEKEVIPAKVENLRKLDYPSDKLTFLWVTDGSTDGSEELLRQYPDMKVLHEPQRSGKVGAINRGMRYVKSEIVIFCDANSMLSPATVREVVRHFQNPRVGCVAGEKHILLPQHEAVQGVGEGVYWKIESFIKRLESEVNSTVGAAGEICAIRTDLFEPLEPDTILDDFVLSLRIVEKGYKIKYAHKAVATETASFSIGDELKRKVRIAAGCIQAIPRLSSLLNIFRYGFFSFQYWSHKVLRWLAVPPAIIIIFLANLFLLSSGVFYKIFFALQIIAYSLVFLGHILRRKNIPFKYLFLPYYFMVMNSALVWGLIRYVRGKQTVNWEKAQRLQMQSGNNH
ncbi:MAG: glycosyltransferase family 2 protein [Bacteroidales bacterium]|nr:glycosyltransferase family 2 protein [Bacteroidales bacterium]